MTRTRIAIVLLSVPAFAQLNVGLFRGIARDEPGLPLTLTGAAGSVWNLKTDAQGEVQAILPYGAYQVRVEKGGYSGTVHIAPLQETVCELSPARVICAYRRPPLGGSRFPASYSLAGLLLQHAPGRISEPLDFNGQGSSVLPWLSDRGISWTATSLRLQGMNANDAYQPGRPVVLPDIQALADVTGPTESGTEIGLFARRSPLSWHGEISTDNTGSPLGAKLQPAGYNWYTRDHIDIGGPVARRADLFFSGTGQWDSQTAPLELPGHDLTSRLLFGNANGRVRTGRTSQFDAQFTGSRLDRSGGSVPAAIEALAGRRMAPPLFPDMDLAEEDHLDFLQAGWTCGTIEVRYGYSTAHLNTYPRGDFGPGAQSRIEMNGGMLAGPPPLANLGARTRHQIEFAAQPGELRLGSQRHQIAAGAGIQIANVRNRFTAPSDLNLLTAGGVPDSVLELNTPLDSRARIGSSSLYAQDRIAIRPWLLLDIGIRADFSRGSLPAQSSPAGQFAPARQFAAQSGVISWNSVAPRFGFSLTPPDLRRLTLRPSFARWLAPLAGRDLDFGNPNSLGGQEYRWQDSNGDGSFQPGEQGLLLRRFGGPHSGIDPNLKRPYADEIRAGAELSLPWRSAARVELFRRDEKDRMAAVNTGVPFDAYQPRAFLDPGPDFIPGTFDDQQLIVYEQNPATFGRDRFLLANPPHLRMLNSGILAGLGAQGHGMAVRASFLAEKSYGPTNPGNALWENDSGVIGALFQDPNTLIHAAGRDFFDRAYVGKLEASAVLPAALENVEIGSVVTYLDGQVFGRQLLVTGLAQGPFLVNATVRGSPEGGHRAQYVLEWDLRLSRGFAAGRGILRIRADAFNLLNGRRKILEDAFSGPQFNQRVALALQPARFVRLGVQYEF